MNIIKLLIIFVSSTKLLAQPKPETLQIVVIGDSVTRGLLAQTQLGGRLSPMDTIFGTILRGLFLNAFTGRDPDGKKSHNFRSMRRVDGLFSRLDLSWVFGKQVDSIVSFLKLRKINFELHDMTQTGLSYSSLPRLIEEKLTVLSEINADLVLILLGGSDYLLGIEAEEFAQSLDESYYLLTQIFPTAGFISAGLFNSAEHLVTGRNLSARVDHTGRVVRNCLEIVKQTSWGDETGLKQNDIAPEQIAAEMLRQTTMDQLIRLKVTSLPQGQFVSMMGDVNLEHILASDCMHLNRHGQSLIANRFKPALVNFIKQL